jgi:type I restriction enzyme S subunit
MDNYQAYSEYKASGVQWLGHIPKHWEWKRIKETAVLINGYPFDSKKFEAGKGMPLVRIRDIRASTTEVGFVGEVPPESLIYNGDVLIGMDGDFNVSLWSGGEAALNQRVACIRAAGFCLQKFIYYVLPFNMKVANDLTYFTTVKHLSSIDILKTVYAFPPEGELNKIVDFLDHETAKIDTLIEKQQQLIKLLKEKRQAVISHAVTKGLNPNAPMRDSGVEWLGEVPEHWQVRRINSIFSESSARARTEEELDYPVLSVSIHHGISDKELNEKELDRKVQRSEDRSLYKVVHHNVLAYNMMRAWQGGFGASKLSGLVSPAYVVCEPKTTLDSYYFELTLRTPNAVTELKRFSRGITDFRLRLYWEEFKNISVPVPPKNEIEMILKAILGINSTYDNLARVAGKQIGLLKERRTALISSAVTGKIDVRNWQAPQPSITNNKEDAA